MEKSDSLFSKGVELYRLNKFEEAIPYFEESDRIDKAEHDSTSMRSEYSAMWLASSLYNLGDTARAQEASGRYYFSTPVDRRLTVMADSIHELGVALYQQENYEEALPLIQEAAELKKEITGENHPYYMWNLADVGRIKFLNWDPSWINDIKRYVDYVFENYDLASPKYYAVVEEWLNSFGFIADNGGVISECEKVVENYRRAGRTDELNYLRLLIKLAELYEKENDQEKSLQLLNEAKTIHEKRNIEFNLDYQQLLYDLAVAYFTRGQRDQTVKLGEDMLSMYETAYGTNNSKYLEVATALAMIYTKVDKYDLSNELLNSCLQIYDEINETDESLKINIYTFLGENCYYTFNYKEAENYYVAALEILNKNPKENETFYHGLHTSLAYSYRRSGNAQKAQETIGELITWYEENNLTQTLQYLDALGSMSEFYPDIEYEKSIDVCKKILEECEKIEEDTREVKTYAFQQIGLSYLTANNYPEAIKYTEMAMSLREQTLGKESSQYISCLLNLATAYTGLDDLIKSMEVCQQGYDICKSVWGPDHVETASVLNFMAYNYYILGDYDNALKYGTQVVEIRKGVLGEENILYAESLNNLSLYKAVKGEYEEAANLCSQALEIYETSLPENSYQIPTALTNICRYKYNAGDYDGSITCGWQAAEKYEKISGNKSETYLLALIRIANAEYYKDNYSEALKLLMRVKEVLEETNSKMGKAYKECLQELPYYYNYFGMEKELTDCVLEHSEILNTKLKYIFSNSTKNNRQIFWNGEKFWFTRAIAFAAKYRSDELLSNGYNCVLTSKGLLLSTDTEFSEIIKNSDDAETIRMYDELTKLTDRLTKLYDTPDGERDADVESLEQEVQELEKKLIARSKNFGDYTHNMSIRWNDIEKNLKANDIAFEFITYELMNRKEYAVLAIEKGAKSPKMITLCTEDELKKISPRRYYNTKELSNLIWKPLEPLIQGKKNIYFSPADELYNIAIESLPHYSEEGVISDYYNLFRLSSTRELALEKDKSKKKDAALFGGMQYDTDPSYLADDMRKYPGLRSMGSSLAESVDSLNLRGGAAFLPQTATEIDNIAASFKRSAISPLFYKGLDGSEASFKSLSGKNINIIHIATHGFYWTESEAQETGLQLYSADQGGGSRNSEDKALTRSGLLFSGANNLLRGNMIPEDVEDGILTAKEISQLDLQGLDLAVLSACQTGLGEITGDGVFGLQRGFKKAGANSLLMSLWKVDDTATQMFMSQFYQNLLAGESKRESLRLAQKYVREYEEEIEVAEESDMTASQKRKSQRMNEETEPVAVEIIRRKPFKDPIYWAAFVLLDALN